MSRKWTVILLCVLLAAGFYFRSGVGLHWDSGQHLHPDERFLTMVTNDIRLPGSLTQYLDSRTSPLSPYNANFGFFVYGTFPIFLTKYTAYFLGYDNYGDIPTVGRIISALFDLGCILLVYLTGVRLYSRQAGLLAACLLTFAVLNIQLSHYYGVETESAFFVLLTFYLALHLYEDKRFMTNSITIAKRYSISILMGLSFGLALASKISSLYLLPTIALIFFFPAVYTLNPREIWRRLRTRECWRTLGMNLAFFMLMMIVSAITFRFFQPYAFSGSSLFDFRLSHKFIANMQEIRSAMKGLADMPPSIQWVDRPAILFSLYNVVVWQFGLLPGIALIFGAVLMLYEIFYKRRYLHVFILSWALFWFLVQSTQFVKAGRYLSIVYPFFALIAAYFLLFLYDLIALRFKAGWLKHLPWTLTVAFSFLWALAFVSIYTKPHTRVAASYWIFENIPCGSKIVNEHWDDGLPLRVGGRDGFGGCYKGSEFNHFWPDNRKKLEDTLSKINEADYIILSSNRIYASLPRLPRRFPFTLEYFRMLFSGDLGFDLVKTFKSYPSIFGIQFNSDYAEEPFTVYDHPKVYIFKKDPERFNIDMIRRRLSSFPDGVHEPLVR